MSAARPPAPHRVLTAWFGDWPVTAAGIDPAEPAAVLRANRVIAVSAAAAVDGVRVGLRRREAQARCAALTVLAHDPDRDARRFEPVARSIGELVPLLEVTEPGLITFPTRGPSRYVGGDVALAERTAVLAGFPVAIGIADGRFASGVAARQAAARGRASIVPTGAEATARFLAPFPVRALHDIGGLGLELVDLFGRLGVRTLGAVTALPGPDLLARFGPEGEAAGILAAGADTDPTAAAPPPPEHVVTRTFDDPVVVLDPLVFVGRQAAGELCEQLAARGLVANRLLVEAETEHGERSDRVWYRPVGLNTAAMVERIRWQLDGWVRQPGGLSGGVVLLRLSAIEVRADSGRQLGFWGGQTQADEWAVRASTRLAGLLGPEAVTVPEWRGGRDPAATYALVPAGACDLTDPAARTQAVRPPAERAAPWPGRLPAPSPAEVLAEPIEAELLDAAGHRVRVSGRGAVSAPPATFVLAGRRHSVIAWAGPWPVEERWWDPATARRGARVQLVTDDGAAALVVLAGGTWRVEARYR